MKLEGACVGITGAAGGIGAAMAKAFAAEGARVALLDVDGAGLEARCAEIAAQGADAQSYLCDVRSLEALESARDEILRRQGRIDLLVNNAGVTTFGPFDAVSDAELRRVVDINLWGVLHGCRAFLPALREAPRAHVVNVASEAGLQGMPWQSIYCATKFAVRGFSASLRAELALEGIGVTCVLPGATATSILSSAGSTEPQTSKRLAQLLEKHAPSPDRVARAVVKGVRRNRAEVFTGPDSRALNWGVRFAPGILRWAMVQTARRARGSASEGPATGADGP